MRRRKGFDFQGIFYRTFVKKLQPVKLQKQDIEPLLADFKQGVKKLYGNRLKAAILFGSYARGEARTDSDI
ncbi:MAG: nucleotidyltransferase domain-containing protein, partial [Bacteroidota bacterium]